MFRQRYPLIFTPLRQAGGKVKSARIVTDVVQRIMERTRVPNTYQLGEVCQILAKDNPELRGKGGCWGIVNHVGEFSCTVKTWDGEYTVGLQHPPEVLQLLAPAVWTDAVNQRSPCANIFRFARGDSQKSVAVVGEGESSLFKGCGREIVDASGVGVWEKTLNNFGNLASNDFGLQFQWS